MAEPIRSYYGIKKTIDVYENKLVIKSEGMLSKSKKEINLRKISRVSIKNGSLLSKDSILIEYSGGKEEVRFASGTDLEKIVEEIMQVKDNYLETVSSQNLFERNGINKFVIIGVIFMVVGLFAIGIGSEKDSEKELQPSESLEKVTNIDNASQHNDASENTVLNQDTEDSSNESEYDMAIAWQSLHDRTITMLDFDSGTAIRFFKKGKLMFTGTCKRLDNGVIYIDVTKPEYFLIDDKGEWAHECDEDGGNVWYGISYSVSDGSEYIELLQEKLKENQ